MSGYTLQFGTYTFTNLTFEVKGLPLEMDLDEAQVPRRQGTRITASRIMGRRIIIEGKLHSADPGTVWADLDLMLRSLSNGEQSLRYRESREIPAWLTKFGHDFVTGAHPTVANVKIELKTQSPFTRGLIPLSTTLTITSVGVTAVTIDYGGTAESAPTYILTALGLPTPSGLQIAHPVRNETLQYNTAIPAGSSVTLDADLMTATQNGVNAVASVEGAFPRLSPGQNVLELSGATYQFHMRYYEQFHD